MGRHRQAEPTVSTGRCSGEAPIGNDSLVWPHLGPLCSPEVAPPPTDRVLRSVVADTTGRRRRDAIEGGAVREYPPRQPAGGHGHPGPGPQAPRAPAHGPSGVAERGTAPAEA